MIELFLVDHVVIMQMAFYTVLFLSLLTIGVYISDLSNRKILYMVLGNLSFMLLYGTVLLGINDYLKTPALVGFFDLLAISFYIIAVFKLFAFDVSKVKLLIINILHISLLIYFDLILDQVSVMRMMTTLFGLILILDAVISTRLQSGMARIRPFNNLFLNVIMFVLYKLSLFGYRLHTITTEVGVDSINTSINVFTFIGLLLIIWINFTLILLNYNLLNTQYKHLSLYDFLTDIPNRRYVTMEIQNAIMDCKKNDSIYGLILLDVDDFKMYNDKFGHDFGDEVLVDFVRNFKTLIRSNDIFARYGGDEFIMLLQIKSREEMTYFVKRVTSYFEKIQLTSRNITMKFSIGKGYIDHTTILDAQKIIDEVDKDLYVNKGK